jgi:hypothetical protein
LWPIKENQHQAIKTCNMERLKILAMTLLAFVSIWGCKDQKALTPAEAKQIAKEAYIYANPIDRYLVNSPMLDDFVRDDDGGITLYIQHESPGEDLQPNWLPAPEGPFFMAMRLYWPKEEALDGSWELPPLKRNQ